jgi:hypothetical protein
MGAPMDARDAAEPINLGSPLRDAAVDPKPWDYLPPTNAGEADPHGPLVVAPGIHGVGPKPIRAGEVFVDDPKKQEAAETALAEAVLVKGQPATANTEPRQATPAEEAGIAATVKAEAKARK